jgi:hypothetical protein
MQEIVQIIFCIIDNKYNLENYIFIIKDNINLYINYFTV